MPDSRVFSFADPDAYQERIRASQAAILALGRGEFQAALIHIDLNRMWMQWGSDSLPRIARSTLDPDRTIVTFAADSEQPSSYIGGRELTHDKIAVYGRGSTNIIRTEAGDRWATMSLTHADLAAAGEAIVGQEIACPSETYLVERPPELLARLRTLHAQAAELARTAPDILATPAVAKSLEQALTHAMITLLAGTGERRWLPGQHAKIANRFQELLESRPDEPVYLAEICSAVGASERTLRTCCQEVLGVGPVRYLWLRRMHLTRQALLRADASATTVTEIATTHGFWELGRFSVEYRGLFGESPSTSLRRSAFIPSTAATPAPSPRIPW
jgi:AraC-like DNA-binding protein